MPSTPKLSFEDTIQHLQNLRPEHHTSYLSMYSSWYGGIVTDTALMLVPIDDHQFHRGDGIFEAFKCVRGNIYLLDAHLDRLQRSAELIDLTWPMSRNELQETIKETIRVANVSDCLIRLYISRGPGDFSPNPYASIGSQLYIVVTSMSEPDHQLRERGCTLTLSKIPLKPGIFSTVKSCNYLPNALMKKEAVDLGVDYCVGLDERGFLAEGPTENLGIVTVDRKLLVPKFDRILRGTTLVRAMHLARELMNTDELTEIQEADLTPEDISQAREVIMFGTTFDALPVVSCQGQSIGDGLPGPISQRLYELLLRDQLEGSEVLTAVF
ncbi:MAG: aminotransferase class IV [Desulfovermiculus sp.]|nr:aminotransferase class IV [Desulfovermiculus sp.]